MVLLAIMAETHIELRHHLHLAFEQFLVVFPYWQVALYEQFRTGRRATDMSNQSHAGIKRLVNGLALDDILSARHQKDGLRPSLQNRAHATIHPFRIISCNATVAHMTPRQQHIPVTSILGQSVAKHHDVSAVNITHGSKLCYTLLIMLRLRTSGKHQEEGENKKDVSSHYYI